uniref:Uncharacterized protein n=1 Tax=Anguilla anguilla TaxID=7936 RepID=A0A0E9W285_ANGAN
MSSCIEEFMGCPCVQCSYPASPFDQNKVL